MLKGHLRSTLLLGSVFLIFRILGFLICLRGTVLIPCPSETTNHIQAGVLGRDWRSSTEAHQNKLMRDFNRNHQPSLSANVTPWERYSFVASDKFTDSGLGNYKLGLKCFAVEPGSVRVVSTQLCFAGYKSQSHRNCHGALPNSNSSSCRSRNYGQRELQWRVESLKPGKPRQFFFIRQPDHKRVRVSLNLASCINTPARANTQASFYSGFELSWLRRACNVVYTSKMDGPDHKFARHSWVAHRGNFLHWRPHGGDLLNILIVSLRCHWG